MQHLLDLPNAKMQLTLWKADLSEEGSYDDAITGCDGVFHVATPMDFESKDPEVSFNIVYFFNLVFASTLNCVLFLFYESERSDKTDSEWNVGDYESMC